MSRREQEIWQVCDDLLAMGKTPREITGEAIASRLRELHLKPGSLTYRYRYRDSWMAERGLSRESSEEIYAKPSDVIERSAAIFKKTIEDSVQEEYETKYQVLNKEVLELNQKYEMNQKELIAVSQDKEALDLELTVAKEQILELNQKLTEEREKRIQTEGQHVLLKEQCEKQQVDFNTQIGELKRNHDNTIRLLQETHATIQSGSRKEIDDLRAHFETQRHQWIVEQDTLKVAKAKLEVQLEKAQYLEKEAQAKLFEIQQAIKEQKIKLEQTQSQYQRLEEVEKNNLQALSASKAENKNLHVQLQETKDQYSQLQIQLLVSREKIGTLEERLNTTLAELQSYKTKDKP